jgi:hypothetical protein
MTLTTAEQWLLIILAAALAVFILLAIAVLIFAIKILRNLRNLTDRAEQVAISVEHTAEAFGKSAGPLAIIRLLAQIIKTVNKTKHGK